MAGKQSPFKLADMVVGSFQFPKGCWFLSHWLRAGGCPPSLSCGPSCADACFIELYKGRRQQEHVSKMETIVLHNLVMDVMDHQFRCNLCSKCKDSLGSAHIQDEVITWGGGGGAKCQEVWGHQKPCQQPPITPQQSGDGGHDNNNDSCHLMGASAVPDPGLNPFCVLSHLIVTLLFEPGERNANPLQYSCLENPVFLPGQRSLAVYSPQGRKELDITGATQPACTLCEPGRYMNFPEFLQQRHENLTGAFHSKYPSFT